MATISVTCSKCKDATSVVKNGKAPTRIQRFFCRSCRYSFQLEYVITQTSQASLS